MAKIIERILIKTESFKKLNENNQNDEKTELKKTLMSAFNHSCMYFTVIFNLVEWSPIQTDFIWTFANCQAVWRKTGKWMIIFEELSIYSFFLHFIWRLWGTDSKKGEVFEKSMAFLKYVCFNINIIVINPSKKTGFDKPVK